MVLNLFLKPHYGASHVYFLTAWYNCPEFAPIGIEILTLRLHSEPHNTLLMWTDWWLFMCSMQTT